MASRQQMNPSSGHCAYFLYVEGLPTSYTWQDLKDLLRSAEASHGIWTSMMEGRNRQSDGKGWVRGARLDEAEAAYMFLTSTFIANRRLRVHLWNISGREPQFWRCNCSGVSVHPAGRHPTQRPEVLQLNGSTGWLPMLPAQSPASTTQSSFAYARASTSRPATTSTPSYLDGFANLSVRSELGDARAIAQSYSDPRQHTQPQRTIASQRPPQPTFTLQNGTPVNISDGVVETEVRSVHVSGLSYEARRQDVEDLFSRIGRVVNFDMPRDASTGRPKGWAIIEYASKAHAQKAKDELDKKVIKRKVIKVKLTKDEVPVTQPPAEQANVLIVNGSERPRERSDRTRNDSAVSFATRY